MYIMRKHMGTEYIITREFDFDAYDTIETIVAWRSSNMLYQVDRKWKTNLPMYMTYISQHELTRYERINTGMSSDDIEGILFLEAI